MGFFGDIWDGFKNLAKDAIEWVGEKLVEGAKAVGKAVFGTIGDAVGSLFGSDDKPSSNQSSSKASNQAPQKPPVAQQTSKEIGSTKSYDVRAATIFETKKIQNELDKFKNEAIWQSEKIEREFFEKGKAAIESLIKPLQDSFGDDKTLENFEQSCQRELDKIKGSAARKINLELSLGNAECLRILELTAGKQKEQKMLDFIKDSVVKAFQAISDSFKESLENNVANLSGIFKAKIDAQQQIYDTELKTLETIKNAQNQEQKQNEQLNLAVQICKKQHILMQMED